MPGSGLALDSKAPSDCSHFVSAIDLLFCIIRVPPQCSCMGHVLEMPGFGGDHCIVCIARFDELEVSPIDATMVACT